MVDLRDVNIIKKEVYSVSYSDFIYTIGIQHVAKIEYHEPVGEGDRHFVDVHSDNGVITRVFAIDEIQFR